MPPSNKCNVTFDVKIIELKGITEQTPSYYSVSLLPKGNVYSTTKVKPVDNRCYYDQTLSLPTTLTQIDNNQWSPFMVKIRVSQYPSEEATKEKDSLTVDTLDFVKFNEQLDPRKKRMLQLTFGTCTLSLCSTIRLGEEKERRKSNAPAPEKLKMIADDNSIDTRDLGLEIEQAAAKAKLMGLNPPRSPSRKHPLHKELSSGSLPLGNTPPSTPPVLQNSDSFGRSQNRNFSFAQQDNNINIRNNRPMDDETYLDPAMIKPRISNLDPPPWKSVNLSNDKPKIRDLERHPESPSGRNAYEEVDYGSKLQYDEARKLDESPPRRESRSRSRPRMDSSPPRRGSSRRERGYSDRESRPSSRRSRGDSRDFDSPPPKPEPSFFASLFPSFILECMSSDERPPPPPRSSRR